MPTESAVGEGFKRFAPGERPRPLSRGVLGEVALCGEARTAARMAAVCRHWADALRSEAVWRPLCARDWPPDGRADASWRARYARRAATEQRVWSGQFAVRRAVLGGLTVTCVAFARSILVLGLAHGGIRLFDLGAGTWLEAPRLSVYGHIESVALLIAPAVDRVGDHDDLVTALAGAQLACYVRGEASVEVYPLAAKGQRRSLGPKGHVLAAWHDRRLACANNDPRGLVHVCDAQTWTETHRLERSWVEIRTRLLEFSADGARLHVLAADREALGVDLCADGSCRLGAGLEFSGLLDLHAAQSLRPMVCLERRLYAQRSDGSLCRTECTSEQPLQVLSVRGHTHFWLRGGPCLESVDILQWESGRELRLVRLDDQGRIQRTILLVAPEGAEHLHCSAVCVDSRFIVLTTATTLFVLDFAPKGDVAKGDVAVPLLNPLAT